MFRFRENNRRRDSRCRLESSGVAWSHLIQCSLESVVSPLAKTLEISRLINGIKTVFLANSDEFAARHLRR